MKFFSQAQLGNSTISPWNPSQQLLEILPSFPKPNKSNKALILFLVLIL